MQRKVQRLKDKLDTHTHTQTHTTLGGGVIIGPDNRQCVLVVPLKGYVPTIRYVSTSISRTQGFVVYFCFLKGYQSDLTSPAENPILTLTVTA